MTGSDLGKVGQEQPASLPLLLLLLTVTTGLIDAVSVLGLGRVFTANMTGNVAFLGFALARVPGFSLVRSLAALAAFLAGAVIGGRLAIRLGADSSLAGGANPRFARRVGSVAAMLAGAVAGGLLVLSVGVAWPLALSGAITLLATLIYVARAAPPSTLSW